MDVNRKQIDEKGCIIRKTEGFENRQELSVNIAEGFCAFSHPAAYMVNLKRCPRSSTEWRPKIRMHYRVTNVIFMWS